MQNPTKSEPTADSAALRSQVESLERQLAAAQGLLQHVVNLTPRGTGEREPFFRAIAELVAEQLGTDCALVGECTPSQRSMRVLAAVADVQPPPERSYSFVGTPSEQVIANLEFKFHADARQAFPNDERLVAWGIQSCAGVPLVDGGGAAIGTIVAKWRAVPEDVPFVQRTLALLARRAERELERMRAEETLIASETRFRTLCEAAPLGIFECDARGYADYINSHWFDAHDYPAKDHFGSGWIQLTHPDDMPGIQEAWHKAFASRSPILHEYRSLQPGKEARWLRVMATPISASGGSATRYVGCVEDITDRKLAELAQRESELRFRAFMDNNPAIAFMKDAQGRRVYNNRHYLERFQVSAEELLGKTDFDMFEPEVAERLKKADAEVMQSGKSIQFEEDVPTPDGVMRHWLVYKFPFVDPFQNQFLGGVAIDITHRREMEEALREARDELEERVSERTADLTKTNARLKQEVLDRKKAEVALTNEQVSLQQMLLSHETDRKLIAYEIHDGPVQYVTAALMHLESAISANGGAKGPLGLAMATPLRLLRETIQESRRMINGLQPMILDESGVVPAIQYLIEGNTGPQTVEFEHQIESERYSPMLEGALFRICQEALNNAYKYSQAKRIKIRLREERGWVRLEVEDDGIGFKPKETERRTFGLNGVRERARLLQGHAIIHSVLGRGTRISVEMPVGEV